MLWIQEEEEISKCGVLMPVVINSNSAGKGINEISEMCVFAYLKDKQM